MHILVVEDDESTALFYRIFLKRVLNANLTMVDTAQAGVLELDDGKQFDAVLTDFNTPQGDGYDVIRAAAAKGIKRIVLVTGQAEPDIFEEIQQKAIRLGAHAVLPKPFSTDAIEKALLA